MSKKDAKKVVVLTGKVDATKYVAEKGYPEVGQFADTKSLQKFYKQLDTKSLEDWAALEGLTYKACPDSEPIHRMRVAMAILYKHFPKESSSKPESPYKQYTLEQLVAMAVEHEVPVEPTDDDRILRMRTIMALRAAKVIG
jgi:hypothetical protein